MDSLFDMMGDILNAEIEKKGKTQHCRTCTHRKSYALNEYSKKVVQCCELKPSRRSNSGYKTIKVTDIACVMYKNKHL